MLSRKIFQYDYDVLEYITLGNSNLYINTGYSPDVNSKIYLKFRGFNPSLNSQLFMGTRYSLGNKQCEIQGSTENSIHYLRYNWGSNSVSAKWGNIGGDNPYFPRVSLQITDIIESIISKNAFELIKNGESQGSYSYSWMGNSWSTNYPIVIGGFNHGTRVEIGSYPVYFYSFKLWENDELKRDMVPARDRITGLYGAYDIENDVFYTSPTGTITDVGSVIYSIKHPIKSGPVV